MDTLEVLCQVQEVSAMILLNIHIRSDIKFLFFIFSDSLGMI